MDKTINNLIDKAVDCLASAQYADGFFNGELCLNAAKKQKLIFSTALILLVLNKAKQTKKLSDIKKKAAQALLFQKDKDWQFCCKGEKNLNVNFCALASLMDYNPEIISGSAIAKILINLASMEIKEGGPYCSDLKCSPKIDLADNVMVAYFLSLQNVRLKSLDCLIESAIKNKDFNSTHYPSQFFIIYIISKFYTKNNEQIIEFLLSSLDENKINLLDKELIFLSLLNLGYPVENLKSLINYFSNSPLAALFKPLAASEKNIAAALYVEAMNAVKNFDKFKINEKTEYKKGIIFNEISKLAKKRLGKLAPDLKKQSLEMLEKTKNADKDGQVFLLPYFFKIALGDKGKKITDDIIIKLGLANLYLWIAYTIYDDFLDEEGDPKKISVANVCLRELVFIFNGIFYEKSNFYHFFHKIMDTIDGANTFEAANCRAKRCKHKLKVKKTFYWSEDDRLADRSIAHALGPIAILFFLEYSEQSPEIKKLFLFFKNYLIARQLSDDIHDWEDDIKKGHITSVVSRIVKKIDKNCIAIDELNVGKIKEEIWFDIASQASGAVLQYIKKAKHSLNLMNVLRDKEFLKKLVLPVENTAKQAIREHKMAIEFLQNYKES